MNFFTKEKRIVHMTNPKQCADICFSFQWCKSFDYVHKSGEKNYKKCFLFEKKISDNPAPITSTNDIARLMYWHFEKVEMQLMMKQ